MKPTRIMKLEFMLTRQYSKYLAFLSSKAVKPCPSQTLNPLLSLKDSQKNYLRTKTLSENRCIWVNPTNSLLRVSLLTSLNIQVFNLTLSLRLNFSLTKISGHNIGKVAAL